MLANGRPGTYGNVAGRMVSGVDWFRRAMETASGQDYISHDIAVSRFLNQSEVATYATAIRAGGKADGEPIGVLAIFFDWTPQAAAVVRTSGCPRTMARHPLSAAGLRAPRDRGVDGAGVLDDVFPLQDGNAASGFYVDNAGRLVAFARTPGYETYPRHGGTASSSTIPCRPPATDTHPTHPAIPALCLRRRAGVWPPCLRARARSRITCLGVQYPV